MTEQVDLYDSHYSNIQAEIHKEIRTETYGEDLGQTSWITVDECRRFLSWLNLSSFSKVLEVACGSGGMSVFIAREAGCEVVGIDINEQGVEAATNRAHQEGLEGQVHFQTVNASGPLPFPDNAFNAIFCNDSINHLPDRLSILNEWYRLLQPSGMLVYTDPIVVTGILTNEEITIRSSIGFFLFTPIGENERLLKQAGFELIRVENVTENMAAVSKRWHDAREKRKDMLVEFEGQEAYEGLQNFLAVVHKLPSEGRLSRYAFCARKRE